MHHALITVKEYVRGPLHYLCVRRVFIGCSDRTQHCTLRTWLHHCDGITSTAKTLEKRLIFFLFFLLLPSLLCAGQNESGTEDTGVKKRKKKKKLQQRDIGRVTGHAAFQILIIALKTFNDP